MITFICVPSEETGTEQFKSLVLYHKYVAAAGFELSLNPKTVLLTTTL